MHQLIQLMDYFLLMPFCLNCCGVITIPAVKSTYRWSKNVEYYFYFFIPHLWELRKINPLTHHFPIAGAKSAGSSLLHQLSHTMHTKAVR
jgi:hypothetical protein